MTIRYLLGVDPGLSGALALLSPSGPVAVFDMPQAECGGIDPTQLANVISEIHSMVPEGCVLTAAVENVHSRPRQAGAFNFGLSVGIIHGILAAYAIPFSLVAPSQWKPAMGLGRIGDETQSQTKDRARALATKHFPALAAQFKRKKDDGRAEALLIAVYHAAKAK